MPEFYCPYCGLPQGDRLSCCSEAHFVPFEDLPEDMQADMLAKLEADFADTQEPQA